MSNQENNTPRGGTFRGVPADGRSIARRSLEMKEQETGVSSATIHPIDTLLVHQLENILNGERALRARYSSIESTSNTPEVRMAFSQELSELKDRADRLYRFMSAMDYYGSLAYHSVPAAGAPLA